MKRTISLLLAVLMISTVVMSFAGCAPKELGEYEADEPHVIDYNLDPNDDSLNPENVPVRNQKTLEGKTIYWLGDSVIYGEMSKGISVADYIAARNHAVCVKEALSGSTMKAADHKQDFVNRLINSQKFDKNAKVDAFIIQISTNDVIAKELWGAVTDSSVTDKDQFDIYTSLGAVEYMIAYIHETWNCPIYFTSGAYFGSTPIDGYVREAFWNSGDGYGELISLVQAAVEKWNAMEGFDVQIIDMYNDESFNNISTAEFQYYTNKIKRGTELADDPIHPVKAGYLYWWTPYIEEFLHYNIGTPK